MIAGLFKKDTAAPGPDNQGGTAGGESIATSGTETEVQESHTSGTPADEAAVNASSAGSPEVTENKILEVLSNVYDPEIPIDIVNLGLIYGIDIDGGNVRISMTMTAPGCPASTQIAGESKILVGEIPGVENVEIDIVWDPPWDPSKMSEEAQDSLGIF
jgi:metal-sulfur cluster biosynthetic enzyme